MKKTRSTFVFVRNSTAQLTSFVVSEFNYCNRFQSTHSGSHRHKTWNEISCSQALAYHAFFARCSVLTSPQSSLITFKKKCQYHKQLSQYDGVDDRQVPMAIKCFTAIHWKCTRCQSVTQYITYRISNQYTAQPTRVRRIVFRTNTSIWLRLRSYQTHKDVVDNVRPDTCENGMRGMDGGDQKMKELNNVYEWLHHTACVVYVHRTTCRIHRWLNDFSVSLKRDKP